MEAIDSGIHQVLVKFLDGKHKFLNFDSSSISIPTLKDQIRRITSIPSDLQLLLSHNSHVLHDHQTLDFNSNSYANTQFSKALDFDFNSQLDTGLPEKSTDGSRNFPVVVHLLLRLRGGKGGFGSLLRGAATKAGQKKTNNFDACRDMSGRRLRHVNAEKKLEEWRAEVQERKLEKMAEDYIKKRTKEALKKGKGSQGEISQKYVMKYQEDSAKCMEEVDRSVKESIKELLSSKRKKDAEASESDSKRLKIWLGKKILDDSDSEDMDDDESDGDEEEKEMSVVIDNGNHSDSSKEADGSSGSITGGKIDSDKGSSGLGSEEEDTVAEESPKSGQRVDACANNSDGENKIESSPEIPEEFADQGVVEEEVPQECESCEVEEIAGQLTGVSTSSEEEGASASEVTKSADPQPGQEEQVSGNVEPPVSDEPLNFDEFNSAAELKVLGLERLKTELQARGLKCGGTLQERAARLFLLKTTPLEKLPKKLFAKK